MLSLRRPNNTGIVIKNSDGDVIATVFRGSHNKMHIIADDNITVDRAEIYLSNEMNLPQEQFKDVSPREMQEYLRGKKKSK